MDYCMVTGGIIENVIVCDSDAYDPPPPPPTLEERVEGLEQTKAEKTDVDAIAAAIEKGLSL